MATEDQCRRAMKIHTERLLKLANVESLGIRELSKAERDTDEGLCVAVYVEKKVPRNELDESEIIPKLLEITEDSETIQVPTGVFAIGKIQVQ